MKKILLTIVALCMIVSMAFAGGFSGNDIFLPTSTGMVTITPTAPTGPITLTLPNTTAALIGSSLTTNNVDAANSVWGASNGLVLEGATADASETTLSPEDPTADNTITIPNDTGAVMIAPDVAGTYGTTYGAGAGAIPITHTYVAYTSVGGAEALTLANGVTGQIINIAHVTDGGNGVLTPATAAGWASVDLADAGDNISLMYVATSGWIILGTSGNAAPPVVTP